MLLLWNYLDSLSYVCVCVCISVCLYVFVCLSVSVCLSLFVSLSMSLCVCLLMFISICGHTEYVICRLMRLSGAVSVYLNVSLS